MKNKKRKEEKLKKIMLMSETTSNFLYQLLLNYFFRQCLLRKNHCCDHKESMEICKSLIPISYGQILYFKYFKSYLDIFCIPILKYLHGFFHYHIKRIKVTEQRAGKVWGWVPFNQNINFHQY